MEFSARISDSDGTLRRTMGRVTGSYLRDAAFEAQRIIERDPGRSTGEIAAEVMQMMNAHGLRHADPDEVRRLVAKVRDEM